MKMSGNGDGPAIGVFLSMASESDGAEMTSQLTAADRPLVLADTLESGVMTSSLRDVTPSGTLTQRHVTGGGEVHCSVLRADTSSAVLLGKRVKMLAGTAVCLPGSVLRDLPPVASPSLLPAEPGLLSVGVLLTAWLTFTLL